MIALHECPLSRVLEPKHVRWLLAAVRKVSQTRGLQLFT